MKNTGKNTNRIKAVSPLTDMRIEVRYQQGNPVIVDCSELAERFAAFSELKDADFFRQVQVADWGHSIEWPNGEGLDADRVMEMALAQSGQTDTLSFRQWQDRHGFSLSQTAQALGLSRRTVSQYRTGTRPLPRVVLLALKGLDAELPQPLPSLAA